MGIKLASPRAELAVLRGMCSRDKKVAGALLSQVDDSYFHSEESKELYDTIRKHMKDSGSTPTYRLLLEDPELSDGARAHMRNSVVTVQSIKDADKATKMLGRYRQRRGLYNIADNINRKLNGAKIDDEGLIDETSTAFNIVRSKKSTQDAFLHFGRNNNSKDTVEDLLYGDNSEDVIPTGIKAYDEVSGGFLRGSLVTLGANSGGGKCCSLTTHIKLSTLVFNLIDDDGIEFFVEAEPEDQLLVKGICGPVFKPASQLCIEDELEIDPEILQTQIQLLKKVS